MAQGVYPIFNMQSEAKLTIRWKSAPQFNSRLHKRMLAAYFPPRTETQEGNYEMTIAVGDKLPDVKLVKATAGGPEAVQSADFFAGKKVALFSVPGAFTPTCSAKHLPGYVEKADELKAKGIDEIACTAVNDAFVMSAWGKANGSDAVTMLADGNGDLVKALGLTMDGSGFGMGTRGQRFSMVVDDGTVTQLNVEAPGDFNVSSAEYMLGQL